MLLVTACDCYSQTGLPMTKAMPGWTTSGYCHAGLLLVTACDYYSQTGRPVDDYSYAGLDCL